MDFQTRCNFWRATISGAALMAFFAVLLAFPLVGRAQPAGDGWVPCPIVPYEWDMNQSGACTLPTTPGVAGYEWAQTQYSSSYCSGVPNGWYQSISGPGQSVWLFLGCWTETEPMTFQPLPFEVWARPLYSAAPPASAASGASATEATLTAVLAAASAAASTAADAQRSLDAVGASVWSVGLAVVAGLGFMFGVRYA